MDPQFVQWIVGQAGVGGLTAFSLWMLNENNKRHVKDITEITARTVEVERKAKEETDRLYRETREALAQNTKAYQDMSMTLREVFINETSDRMR